MSTLATGQCVDVLAGTTIYRPGDDPEAFVVVHGLLRVHMNSPEERQVTVRYTRAVRLLDPTALHDECLRVG